MDDKLPVTALAQNAASPPIVKRQSSITIRIKPPEVVAIQRDLDKINTLKKEVEKQMYELEDRYIDETSAYGNLVKGWEGFLDGKPSRQVVKKDRRIKPAERIFSHSSVTAPIHKGTGATSSGGTKRAMDGSAGGERALKKSKTVDRRGRKKKSLKSVKRSSTTGTG